MDEELQAETDRASRVEASLAAAMHAIEAKEHELAEAYRNLQSLTAALDRTFGDLDDLSDLPQESAA